MELILLYFPMYILFSFLLMIVFQIIGKNGALAFIPIYSMYTALKFLKGRIYYRNWGMFFFINLILIIGNMLVYLPIIKDRLWVCVLFVVWNIYYLFKFVIYMVIGPGNFLVIYIIYGINCVLNIFFIFYIANIYKKLQLENKTIVSEIDYDKYSRSEIKRIIRSRNYNLFEN